MTQHNAASAEQSPRSHSAERAAAMELVTCLQRFAARNTNAVLSILADQPFIAQKHYPDGDLVFGGGCWRAYYHAHDMPGAADSRIHGHFHIFSRPDPTSHFAHVVGLAVDGHGQPLKWFASNHWVTGEAWRPAKQLAAQMPPPETEISPAAACWLSAMLRFAGPHIEALLCERDAALAAHCAQTGCSADQARADRTLYILAQREIDLMSELRAALALEGEG